MSFCNQYRKTLRLKDIPEDLKKYTLPTICSLNVVLSNIRSINNKLDEVTNYTNIEKPDILCFTESWVQDPNLPFHPTVTQNYNIVHCIRPNNKKGGGK